MRVAIHCVLAFAVGIASAGLAAAQAPSTNPRGDSNAAPTVGAMEDTSGGWGRIGGTISGKLGNTLGQSVDSTTNSPAPGRYGPTGWTTAPPEEPGRYGIDAQGFMWYRNPVTGQIQYYSPRETRYFRLNR